MPIRTIITVTDTRGPSSTLVHGITGIIIGATIGIRAPIIVGTTKPNALFVYRAGREIPGQLFFLPD
jgi:hypothetical protein